MSFYNTLHIRKRFAPLLSFWRKTRLWALGSFIMSICLLFFSCKKEEGFLPPDSFPAEFLAERIEVKSQTRVFTQTGEVKDAQTIIRFEKLLDWPENIELQFQERKDQLGFAFINDSTVIFAQEPFTGLIKNTTYNLQRKGNRFLFTSLEEFPIHTNLSPSGYQWGYLYHILKHKEKINPLTAALPGSAFTHATKHVRVAHGNFKVLKASCFNYHLKIQTSENSGEFESKNGLIFNEVEGMPGKFLGVRDTLVFKEYSTIFTIRQ